MKKIFQIIGLIGLTCFSFFITEKTTIVVNNMDEIMIQIKDNVDYYKKESIDAIVENDTIIPGLNGRTVNINKSYKNMKSNGYYSDKFFIYDYIKPSISLYNNMDKYIIKGNPSKRMISLMFLLKGNEDISEILNILDNYNVSATFFVDYSWFNKNNELVKKMITNNHIVSPFMMDYSDSNFEWMDMILRKVNKEKNTFCLYLDNNIEECIVKGYYLIKPTIISNKTPLVDIKSKIESGSLFLLSNNYELKKELSTIIIFIKSKGYVLSNLQYHIEE